MTNVFLARLIDCFNSSHFGDAGVEQSANLVDN